jgi:hypothetical protein
MVLKLFVLLWYHFQEVDRFQELEKELKLRGYSGIWKVRFPAIMSQEHSYPLLSTCVCRKGMCIYQTLLNTNMHFHLHIGLLNIRG